jgi:HD superfamily phosphohydrolase
MSGKRSNPLATPLPLAGRVREQGNESSSGQLSTKAERQEFFLPVTGFVWFYPEEVQVINHPAFQRLGRINQLGQAHLVFRGATHKRIEHVLGTVGVVQQMISAVHFNAEKSRARGRVGFSPPLNKEEERFVRLGALLHDIGHLAAGHTLEDELELIGKHDSENRLRIIFDKADWDGTAARGIPTLRAVINENYTKCMPKGLVANGLTASDLVLLLISKKPMASETYIAFDSHLRESSEIRYQVCANMIGNTICADLLDYIYRDWYHVGKPRSAEDRIFQYMEIRRPRKNGGLPNGTEPVPHPDDRFVLSLGEKTKIRTDGVSAILGLLEWRYELAETVLFHRTKVAAGAMLDRALYELWEDVGDEGALVSKLLKFSDDQLLDEAIREGEARVQGGTAEEHPNADAAVSILQKLRDRTLFKELGTYDATNLPDLHIPKIKKDYAGLGARTRRGAKCRAQTARLLEYDFRLPRGSIAIYCTQIKPKIAEVAINVDGEIQEFSEYEKTKKNRLSGGHLDAQLQRFERLWRIYFFIDAGVRRGLSKERLLILQQTIEQVVLVIDDADRLIQRAKEKAMMFAFQETRKGNNSIRFVDELITAARSDSEIARDTYYPNGAPSVRSFLRED